MPAPRIRRDAARLSQAERDRFIDALKAMKAIPVKLPGNQKKTNRYDQFVAIHTAVMMRWDRKDPTRELFDGAHRGPAFLPWHREYLLKFEDELRKIDKKVTIPYWDFSDHVSSEAMVLTDDFMGRPHGDSDGFLYESFLAVGKWKIDPRLNSKMFGKGRNFGTAIRRFGEFDRTGIIPTWIGFRPFSTLPKRSDVERVLSKSRYDDFRLALEGERPFPFGSPTMHDRVHAWIGGRKRYGFRYVPGSMYIMTAPNDPIFWLLHANIDRIWAQWQARYGKRKYTALPRNKLRFGHAKDDPMWPWDGGIVRTMPMLEPWIPYDKSYVQAEHTFDYPGKKYVYED